MGIGQPILVPSLGVLKSLLRKLGELCGLRVNDVPLFESIAFTVLRQVFFVLAGGLLGLCKHFLLDEAPAWCKLIEVPYN